MIVGNSRIFRSNIARRIQCAAMLAAVLQWSAAFHSQVFAQTTSRVTSTVDSGIAFTYTVRTNRTDTIAVEQWNSRAEVLMKRGEIRMNLVAGEPLLCCTPDRVTVARMGQYFPQFEHGASSLLFLDDGRLIVTIAKTGKMFTAMNAGTFSIGVRPPSLHSVTMLRGGDLSYSDLGDGPRIEGFATRHVQIVETYDFGMTKNQGEDWETRSDTSDIWISKNLRIDPASASAWSHTFGTVGQFSAPRLRDALKPYVRQFGCTGIPLRIVSRMYARPVAGSWRMTSPADTVEVRISNVRSVSLDPTQFRPPSKPASIVSTSSDSLETAEALWSRVTASHPPVLVCDSATPLPK